MFTMSTECLPTTLPTALPTGLPTDFIIHFAHCCHRTCCNGNSTCLSIILGLKMICHYLSSLIEFFVLKGNNEDFARADSSSENLYRILVILLIGWPFVYVGFFFIINLSMKTSIQLFTMGVQIGIYDFRCFSARVHNIRYWYTSRRPWSWWNIYSNWHFYRYWSFYFSTLCVFFFCQRQWKIQLHANVSFTRGGIDYKNDCIWKKNVLFYT